MLGGSGGAQLGGVARPPARQLRQQAGVAEQRDEQHLRRLRAVRVVGARSYPRLLEHPGAGQFISVMGDTERLARATRALVKE